MDHYTAKTKNWLETRFKNCDEKGIYYAHQPIYGFREGHSEPGLIERYIRTFQIMKALSHFKFKSLLDVGAAEGYKAYVAKKLFGAEVKCCDLSEEACKRSKEIYNIDSKQADIHNLPFRNNEFDVVLCSETLEHVTDLNKSINELLRVANKAVIITVPHESTKIVKGNIKQEEPHGHIHNFDLQSFNSLDQKINCVVRRRICSKLVQIPGIIAEAMPVEHPVKMKFPKIFIRLYNASIPILRKLFGINMAVFLINLDDFICSFKSPHNAILFIIIKDKNAFQKMRSRDISARKIISFAVPYYYPIKYK